MISRIRGRLHQVIDKMALVENSGIYYEIMLPSALAERLKENGSIGKDISFDTIYFIEAGDRKSNHYPRIVGFTNPVDREFFSKFTQVPGLGVKKALKSLTLPIKEIALAIETKNPAALGQLPGVGARLAEKIIAELHGKMAKFALSREDEPLATAGKPVAASPIENEALMVLEQLQYSQNEARMMIQKALKDNPKIKKVEDLIESIFKSAQAEPGVG